MYIMRRIYTHLGLVIIVSLCLFPVIQWFMMKPLELRFGSYVMWATSLGQLSALLGFSMFSVSLILIARLKWLEPIFGGLDRIFQAHRYLGMYGFLLMLFHPLALAMVYIPVSIATAAMFFLPTIADPLRSLGIVALILMMLLLIATFFAHWRYQALLGAHRFLGFAFMLGTLHAMLIPSDISKNTTLMVYCGTLAFFAILAYLYRTLLKKIVPKYHYMVTEVRALPGGVTDIALKSVDKPLRFKPGQFVFISFKNGGVSEEVHPFSISSAPQSTDLHLTIKALGDWTTEVPCLAVGATASIEGPFGGFTEDRSVTPKREVWVAGGIGITPFLSRARSIAYTGTTKTIDFYYTTNTREEMLFLSELQIIAKTQPNLRIIPHASKDSGFLSAATLHQHSAPLRETDIFVCGPPPMMKSIIRQCKDLGVPASQIHAEEFSML